MIGRGASTLLLSALMVGAVPVTGQTSSGNGQIVVPATLSTVEPPDVPFGPGERLEYKVKLGVFNVGQGSLEVVGLDTIRGQTAYHLQLALNASQFFGAIKVRDRFDSWMDVHSLASLRFHKDQHEVSYKSQKKYEIFPDEQRWGRGDAGTDSGETLSDQPLDEIAFLYFIRTLPLEVGEEYTFNHYFKEDGNPIVLKVLRRETKEVPAGTFETIVVQPIIQTDGLFSEGGEAEVYFTDDEERRIVYLRSEIPVVGSITLHLEKIIENHVRPGSGG